MFLTFLRHLIVLYDRYEKESFHKLLLITIYNTNTYIDNIFLTVINNLLNFLKWSIFY